MNNDQGDDWSGAGSSRRTFLRATATTGAVLGLGGMTYAQDQQFSEIQLGGVVAGWRGRAPAFLEGETNPTLPLQAGQEYTIVWENVDGEPHNVAIFDQGGNVVVRSEIISEQGATQEVTFTAEPGMTTYLCQVHPTSMRGDVDVQGGDGAMNETVMPANETPANETMMENVTVPVNESAWGEDPLIYIAEFANGTQPAGNLTGTVFNGTVQAGNATAPTGGGTGPAGDGTAAGNETEGNQTALEVQGPPEENATEADDGTVDVGNGTTENETMAVAENGTVPADNGTMAGGNETPAVGAGEQTSAVRFTLHPPNGVQPRLLYNVAIWGVEDVTGADIVLVGQDGEAQAVASLLAPDDPIDYPAGVIAHGSIVAADLLGPLAGESLRALVREIDERDAYVVVRTRDQGVLRARIRPTEEQRTDDRTQQSEESE